MKIECLVCLKDTAIPKNINTQKYDGQITCRECHSLLQVKLVKSKVEQCKVVVEGKDRFTTGKTAEVPSQARREGRFYLEEK